MNPLRPALLSGLALSTLVLWQACAVAAPYVPARDDEVVETLRRRPLDAQERAARLLRAEARRQPQNLPLALRAAHAAIERARRDGDPRELGQAQAALAPWWSLSEPPAAVRLLRAIVLQSKHAFAPALADLDRVIGAPAPIELQAQAELTRASVLQVLGHYGEAAAGCERLLSPRHRALGAGVELSARACLAELMSLRGRTAQARRALDQLAGEAGPTQAGWLALVRAELAERMGDARAEVLYPQALGNADGTPDVYPLAAYADWLLDHDRAREAATLLEGREQADALLLRLALAWHRLNDGRSQRAAGELRQRFEATRLRGDAPHLREEAAAALHLQGDAARALMLARENWAVQKEPADARLLVEAALAAGQPAAAEPVRNFMRETGYTDTRLERRLP